MWGVYGELCGVLRFWFERGDALVFDVASAAGSEDTEFAELEGERCCCLPMQMDVGGRGSDGGGRRMTLRNPKGRNWCR
jgi:hypothetical protein